MKRLPFYGVAYVCADDPEALDLIRDIKANVVTYGLNEGADYRALHVKHENGKEIFDLSISGRSNNIPFVLNMSGEHNVQNALAAIAVAVDLGIEINTLKRSLEIFGGIDRRFQVYEKVKLSSSLVTVVDDYSHHPTEIKAVIKTIRRRWPNNRLVILFQPHRFSRTKELFEDFVNVLSESDMVILFEVYSAGEKQIVGADGRSLARSLRNRGNFDPVFLDHFVSLDVAVSAVAKNGDVIAVIGAGSIGRLVEEFLAA
jgi:UDP-N-acetylmuramate-alanine ligase